MKIVIQRKSGPFGRWRNYDEIDVGPQRYKMIRLTPAAQALDMEKKMNGGLTSWQAESIYPKTGMHNAPIFKVVAVNDGGKTVY